jgi:antitoxin YobK
VSCIIPRVTSETIELIERVKRRLGEASAPCSIAGPASEAQVAAAEEALGCAFPPSYRRFLRKYGAISLPTDMSVVHDFLGLGTAGASVAKTVVDQTLSGRSENRLPAGLIVVGMGSGYREWFCLDLDRADDDGECPIILFDARDNALDQQFYDGYDQMLTEVLAFVEQNLDGDLSQP